MNDKKKISDKDAKKTVRSSNKKNWIIELIEKNKNEEDGFEEWEKVSAKKTRKRTVESDKKSKRKKVSKK
jgi:23S rRNA A1618 N6-methylase RlmF